MPSQLPKPPTPHRADDGSVMASHIHSGVILGVSRFFFNKVVADPPSALLSTLPWLALTQLAYAVLCLDPSASKGKRAKAFKKGDPAAGISSRLLVRAPRPLRVWDPLTICSRLSWRCCSHQQPAR